MPRVEAILNKQSLRPIIEPDAGRCYARPTMVLLLIMGVCISAFGCRDVATIWSAEARSPDGHWLASARTKQYGGPGAAGVQTSVYLKRTNDSRPPIEILGLSNESAYPPGITGVVMNWLTPSHLEVTYKGHASLYFQVVKCAGIDISVRDLSSKATNP
jgi:hypothetical protein